MGRWKTAWMLAATPAQVQNALHHMSCAAAAHVGVLCLCCTPAPQARENPEPKFGM